MFHKISISLIVCNLAVLVSALLRIMRLGGSEKGHSTQSYTGPAVNLVAFITARTFGSADIQKHQNEAHGITSQLDWRGEGGIIVTRVPEEIAAV